MNQKGPAGLAVIKSSRIPEGNEAPFVNQKGPAGLAVGKSSRIPEGNEAPFVNQKGPVGLAVGKSSRISEGHDGALRESQATNGKIHLMNYFFTFMPFIFPVKWYNRND